MKTLQELTLLDKFLFDQTMDCPEAHEAALQIILGQEQLRLLTPAQTEKEIRTAPWLRSIRLDVYALGEDKTIYNTEMQAEPRNDLAKRSRYYQGMIDATILPPGTAGFRSLNPVCVIMITPFDLFGKGRYRYTFRSYCEEDKEICLEDGAVRIFLNTKGKNRDEVSRELADFLRYVETADGKFAESTGSERIRKIDRCVRRIKASEEAGVKYMQTWEQEILLREQGREEGRSEGFSAGREEGLAAGREEGRNEGLAAGREEGRSEGLAAGREEGLVAGRSEGLKQGSLNALSRMIANLHLTPDQAMDALEIAPEEREKYRELLKGQEVSH